MDVVEEIKTKLNLVQVISEYLPLKKSGINWKACCPFHGEKTPSFMVNEDRQFYYCFGCNEGGDLFTFVQKIEGLDFPEALKLLAAKAGVALPEFDHQLENQRTRLANILDLATRFFQNNLSTSLGVKAKDYLVKRQLNDTTIQDFKLGYAPESWDALMKFLLAKGYTETEIFQAGLTVRKERGSGYYDRFRDRVMFPIQDIHGNVIGFTARTLKAEESAKYINTPETSFYHKSEVLYGLDKAKAEIRSKDFVILVEGNMDVITSHRVGIKNVVAVSGTALTQEQINLLKRFTSNVAFCFDMDEAGQKAAQRSIDLALQNNLNLKIIQLKEAKDPDECIKKDPHAWVKAIEAARAVMQFQIDRVLKKFDVAKIDHKKKAADILLLELQKLGSPVERDYWLQEIASLLDISANVLRETASAFSKLGSAPSQNSSKAVTSNPVLASVSQNVLSEDILISFLLNYPSDIKFCSEQLLPEAVNSAYQKLYTQLVFWYNENNQITREQVIDLILQAKLLDEKALNSSLLLMDRLFENLTVAELERELARLVVKIKKNYFEQRINELERQMREKEVIGDRAGMEALIREIQSLNFQKTKI